MAETHPSVTLKFAATVTEVQFAWETEMTVAPGAYVVLCEDATRFNRVYPNVANYIGDFAFGLDNGGDTVRLFDPNGALMFSIKYDDKAPWPSQADGTGKTLQLIKPSSFSGNSADWTFSPNVGGTPGRATPY